MEKKKTFMDLDDNTSDVIKRAKKAQKVNTLDKELIDKLKEKNKRQYAYQKEFDKKTYKQNSLKLNKFTETDLIYDLEQQPEGKKEYIRRLMREEMLRHPESHQIPADIIENVRKTRTEKGLLTPSIPEQIALDPRKHNYANLERKHQMAMELYLGKYFHSTDEGMMRLINSVGFDTDADKAFSKLMENTLHGIRDMLNIKAIYMIASIIESYDYEVPLQDTTDYFYGYRHTEGENR